MRISLGWIGDFVSLEGTAPEEVAELLSLHTAEVEGVEHFGEALRDVRVGRVVECGRHPNADKLSLTRVDFGAGETVPVVCGAANVRQGLMVAFAPLGTTLPGGRRIKKAKLRGQVSCGMICSARELELGEDHAGILELDGDAPLGARLVEWLGIEDAVLELDNKSLTHRPDLWGHYGFAREIAALLRRPLRPLPVLEQWPEGEAGVPITIEDRSGCPMYLGLRVDLGGRPRSSTGKVRQRLLAVGQRPVNDLVDLTNYVLHELGQPTHAFDVSRLAGGIRVRAARQGERLTTLDGVDRGLDPRDLLICDDAGPVALAGVMGGESSEVGEETTGILLESAVFDPARVRRTSARQGLRTEASARFEKSLDPALAELALRRFALLLAEQRPEAALPGPPAAAGDAAAPAIRIGFDPGRAAQLLGLELAESQMRDSLESLGFGVAAGAEGGTWTVSVPSWRATKDVTTEVDLVEEVGRMAGYHDIRPRAMVAPLEVSWDDPVRLLARRLADRLALAHGGYETQGYSFLGRRWIDLLRLPEEAFLSLSNPVQSGVDLVRRDPLPSLIEQAERNLRERESGLLFEIARGYEPRADGLPRERRWLGAVLWRRRGGPPAGPDSLAGHCRTILLDLVEAAAPQLLPEGRPVGGQRLAAPWGHPARLLEWRAGEEGLGFSGPLDPRLASGLGMERVEAGAVLLDLDALAAAGAGRRPRFLAPGRYPAVKVDVALALPRRIPFAEVEAALRKAGGRLLEKLTLFDLFEGGAVGVGRRSLAFHAVLRAADRTLEEKDERRFLDRVRRAAESLGGELRGGPQEPGSAGEGA